MALDKANIFKLKVSEFVKYKNSLLEMLDSDTFSTEEKVILLIYLCIIEKDFQSITEMG